MLDGMPVGLHHIVIDARDLPGLARFWTQALGWRILSEGEREIVIGTDDTAPVGICCMPVTEPKTVKNRVHLDLTASVAERDGEIERLLALGLAGSISGRAAPSPGRCWPTRRETSSASYARRKRSPVKASPAGARPAGLRSERCRLALFVRCCWPSPRRSR